MYKTYENASVDSKEISDLKGASQTTEAIEVLSLEQLMMVGGGQGIVNTI